MTITNRTYSRNTLNADNFVFRISNPASSPNQYNNYSMSTGKLSGSETIYFYLEEAEDKKHYLAQLNAVIRCSNFRIFRMAGSLINQGFLRPFPYPGFSALLTRF